MSEITAEQCNNPDQLPQQTVLCRSFSILAEQKRGISKSRKPGKEKHLFKNRAVFLTV